MGQEEMINKLILLAEKSEARIDRTNAMVCKMVDVCQHSHQVLDKITDTYAHHLDSLAQCRNDLIAQNKTLMHLHEQDLASLNEMRREMVESRNRLFDLLKNIQGGIRIENK